MYIIHNNHSVDQIKNEMWGYVESKEEGRGAYVILVGRSEGRRPLGRPRRRWKDNIKPDPSRSEIGGHGMERSGSGEGQVAGSFECGNEPSGSIK
jgi:hypothetical protein